MLRDRIVIPASQLDAEKMLETLKHSGINLNPFAEETIRTRFKSTENVVCELGVLRNKDLRDCDGVNTTLNFDKVAHQRDWRYAPILCAPFLRLGVSDKEMEEAGLTTLVLRHEPVEINRQPYNLSLHTPNGGNWLAMHAVLPGSCYIDSFGLVYLISVQ